MDKYIFNESTGLWYELVGDYYLPCLKLPEEQQRPVGVWGQRHLRHIRHHKRAFHTSLVLQGKLNSYLADVNEQAQEMYLWLIDQMAEQEGIAELLKEKNQMEWVRRMSNIHNRAEEIISNEYIYR